MKKIILIISLLLVVVSMAFTVSAYSDSFYSNGDVDLDGRLSIGDGTEIQRGLAEIKILTEQQKKLADFNLDGEVNILDVTKIQSVLTELEEAPTEITTTPEIQYVTPQEFGMVPDANDDSRLFQKVLDAAEAKGVSVNLEGKTYHIYTSEARCPIVNGSLKIMPSSSLVLIGDKVSLKNVDVSRWWKGDSNWYGDVRLHLTDGCVIEDCNFSAYASSPRIFCNTSANNTTIRNCAFSEGFGILFNDGEPDNRKYNGVVYTDTIGKGLIVDNCTFNTEGKAVEYAGDNVEVNTPNHRFSDVRVTNCVSYGAKEDYNVGMGFGFAQVDNIVCSNNILSNIEGSGAIHMEACTNVESNDNVIENSHYGIMCIYNQDAVYDNNTITGCEYGIYCMAQYPYGYDERIGFYNNKVINNMCSFIGAGFRDSEIINNYFLSDCDYLIPIIKLEYNQHYESKNVIVAENTIEYTGNRSDGNWAYLRGADCKVYDNIITGFDSSNYINDNNLKIRLKLNLPENTPMSDKLYFVSNLNGWSADDENYVLTRTSKTTAEIIVSIPENFDEIVEYKITRGSWDKGECNADGFGNVGENGNQNHTLDIYGDWGGGYTQMNIINWTDLLVINA